MARIDQWIERVGNLFAIAASATALAVAGFVMVPRIARPAAATNKDPIAITDWGRLVAQGHRNGPDNARVTIIEFGDYQCPACRAWQPHIDAVRSEFPEEVAFVYLHYPLSYHQFAYAAARAAECADAQGAFWPFHRLLYTEDNWFGSALLKLAADAGVANLEKFNACISGNGKVDRIEADRKAAEQLESDGTPIVIINGLLLRTAFDSVSLADRIRGIINASS